MNLFSMALGALGMVAFIWAIATVYEKGYKRGFGDGKRGVWTLSADKEGGNHG